ncbi:MAG: M48 family metalloprotease [Treponema sp.]|nr:M48 family metalloprotease [Treponema sp.]
MKRYLFLLIVLFCAGSLVFAQSNQTRYVAAQNVPLKSSTGFFSKELASLKYGTAVTLVRVDGKWSQVRSGNNTGWVASDNLSSRQLVQSGSSSITASEVALAGKGFSPSSEVEYKQSGLDYTLVDEMEKITVPLDTLSRFVDEGRLAKGEGKSANSNPFSGNVNPFASTGEDDFTPVDTYYLGRAVAANIVKAYRPYTTNQEMIQYLNRICQTIVINSFKPPTFNGYYVTILDSDEYNAFATPGGHIFITRKLIESTTSEDMLAAVIAHELAHVMLRHGTAIISDTKFESEMFAIAGRAASSAAKLSTNPNANKTLSYRNAVANTVETLLKNGYSQTQEFEADIEAAELLANAGYNPGALVDLLNVLRKFQGSQKVGFYSTHPSPADRISNVESSGRRLVVQDTRQYRVSRFKNRV